MSAEMIRMIAFTCVLIYFCASIAVDVAKCIWTKMSWQLILDIAFSTFALACTIILY